MHGSTVVNVGLRELGVAHARRRVAAMGEGGEHRKDGKKEMVVVAHRGHERRLDRQLGFCCGEERWRRMRGLNREMLCKIPS